MSVSILEALQNAKYNLIDNGGIGPIGKIGKEQLKNAVALLDKGYSLEQQVEPLLEKYGLVENVPDKI